jgi:hypothetical protein
MALLAAATPAASRCRAAATMVGSSPRREAMLSALLRPAMMWQQQQQQQQLQRLPPCWHTAEELDCSAKIILHRHTVFQRTWHAPQQLLCWRQGLSIKLHDCIPCLSIATHVA